MPPKTLHSKPLDLSKDFASSSWDKPTRALALAIHDDDLDGVKAAIAAGAIINTVISSRAESEFMPSHGTDLQYFGSPGHSFLAIAQHHGRRYRDKPDSYAIFQALLKAGADPNLVGASHRVGYTLFYEALNEPDNLENIRHLLKAGVDPHAYYPRSNPPDPLNTADGLTQHPLFALICTSAQSNTLPYLDAILKVHPDYIQTIPSVVMPDLLHAAATCKMGVFIPPLLTHPEIALLINTPNPASPQQGLTPLMAVFKSCHSYVNYHRLDNSAAQSKRHAITALLERGADPFLTNSNGESARSLSDDRGGIFKDLLDAFELRTLLHKDASTTPPSNPAPTRTFSL